MCIEQLFSKNEMRSVPKGQLLFRCDGLLNEPLFYRQPGQSGTSMKTTNVMSACPGLKWNLYLRSHPMVPGLDFF